MAKSKLLRYLSALMASAMLMTGVGFTGTVSATDETGLVSEIVQTASDDAAGADETQSAGSDVFSGGEINSGETSTENDAEGQEENVVTSAIGGRIVGNNAAISTIPEGSTFTPNMPNSTVFEANFFDVVPDTETQFTKSFTVAASPADGFNGFQFQANLNNATNRPIIYFTGGTVFEIDGVTYDRHIGFGGSTQADGRFILFNVPQGVSHARLHVYGIANGTNQRTLALRSGHNRSGDIIEEISFFGRENVQKLDWLIPGGGNYTLTTGADVRLYVLRLEYTFDERPSWSEVTAPEVTNVEYNVDKADNSTVIFDWNGDISFDGADRIIGHLCNEFGGTLDTTYTTAIGTTSGTFTLPIPASGNFKVKVAAVRDNEGEENAKESEYTEPYKVILPLVAPTILNTDVRDESTGHFVLKWSNVTEVEKYRVEYKLSDAEEWITLPDKDSDTREHEFFGLTSGASYDFRVTSIRGDETGVSYVAKKEIKETARKWIYQGVGKGGSYAENLIIPYDKDGNPVQHGTKSVTVTENGEQVVVDRPVYGIEGNEMQTWEEEELPTKILMEPDEGTKYTDGHNGFTYFYTEIDPTREHWSIEATFTIKNRYKRDALKNQITGPEGVIVADTQTSFGIIAADIAPGHDYYPYINTAAVAFGRLRYMKVDGTYQRLESAPGGIFKGGYTDPTGLSSPTSHISFTVDTDVFNADFNLDYTIGGYEHRFKIGDTYTMKMVRDNTGFRTYLLSGNGSKYNFKRITCYEPDMVLKQDSDRYYIGVFASRKIAVDITGMKFEAYEPLSLEDDPIEARPKIQMGTSFKLDSTTTTGDENYAAAFYSNLDGTVYLTDTEGNVKTSPYDIIAEERMVIPLKLKTGGNTFMAVFTPYPDEKQSKLPPDFTVQSLEPSYARFTINYKNIGEADKAIYISQSGSVNAPGTKSQPMDLYTALAYSKPGQQFILLGGEDEKDPKSRYYLRKSINIERGNDGGTLMAEPGKTVIFDLADSTNGGFTIKGDNWHFYGFDICNAQIMLSGKPILVSGNNNRIEKIRVYDNADTGISINGVSTEPFSLWPQNNLVISSEVWNSCDIGLNNADGFTAKITVGNGNKFKYCISHHNIDDGWDLFAQATTGPIGEVTIEDCVAYSNGTTSGNKLTTGEGNGFKLGGTHTPGAHLLKNSISFDNRNNGITSNSGSGVRLYNNTSIMNRQGSGINLYSNDVSKKWQLVNNVTDSMTVSNNIDSNNYSNNTLIDISIAEDMYIKTDYEQTDPTVTYYDREGVVFDQKDASGKPISFDSLSAETKKLLSPVYTYGVDQPEIRANGTIDMKGLFVLKSSSNKGADFSALVSEQKTITINPEQDATVTKTGGGSGGGGGGGGGGGAVSTATTEKTSADTAKTNTAQVTVKPLTESVAVAAVEKEVSSALKKAAAAGTSVAVNSVDVKLRNISTVSQETFKAMVDVANESGSKVNLISDNLSADGKRVDVRITVDPSKATKTVNLSASTTNATAAKVKTRFTKHFSNVLSVVSLNQSGDFGMTVRVAAKVNIDANDSIRFYSYDTKTNKYKALNNTDYRIDKNGYVHFNTSVGGSIIISEGKLKKL